MKQLQRIYGFLLPKAKKLFTVACLKYDEYDQPSPLPLRYLHAYKRINFGGEDIYTIDWEMAEIDRMLNHIWKAFMIIILISVVVIISPLHGRI